MDAFKQEAIALKVNKLFKKDWFDICEFDSIARYLGVKPPENIYRDLRAIHCVHYSEMSDNMLVELQRKVATALSRTPLNPALVTAQILAEGNDMAAIEDRPIDGWDNLKRLN